MDLLSARPDVDADKIAAMGYCFGGAIVLHEARIGMPLRAVVSFHGSLGSFHKPEKGGVRARVLVCHGAADALVPKEDVANLASYLKGNAVLTNATIARKTY